MFRPAFILTLCLAILPPQGAAHAQESVTVLSAETIELNGTRYRLAGIDAPEPGQRCWLTSHLYPCDEIAHAALMDLVAGSAEVRCQPLDKMPLADGTITARCFSEGYDLAEGMTYTGWALADGTAGGPYHTVEAAARKAKRGLWRGRFVPPRDWRAGARLPEEAKAASGASGG
jgi:endonuclease YncB( thermonuclease family)